MKDYTLIGLLVITSAFFPLTMRGVSLSIQQPERLVEQKTAPNEPVKIVAVKNKRANLEIGTKFEDDEEWLKGLTLEISNTYQKAIQYVSVELRFPRPKGETEPPLATSLTYGQDPSSPIKAPPDELKPILPGQSVNLKLPDTEHDSLRQILKSLKYQERTDRIMLRLEEVLFEDGTKWVAGLFFRRDENNPGKWVPIQDL